MPVYEYDCSKHGRFESVQPMSKSDDTQPCPKCKKQTERVDSIPARRNPEYGIQR